MAIVGILLMIQTWPSSAAFQALPTKPRDFQFKDTDAKILLSNSNDNENDLASASSMERRQVLTSILSSTAGLTMMVFQPNSATASEEQGEESFASIAARASQISKNMEKDVAAVAVSQRKSDKTAYDFSLPVEGNQVPFGEMIRQEFTDVTDGEGGTAKIGSKIKAILVVNIKQDDPVARKTIPELISLAAKYGRGEDGAFAVVACPTDQGYYEPDTSTLIRLKLASEYGYGINPSTVLTDKVNLLGSGAHPFWRWLQSTCRTPSGLGRIEGNFEKFLLDGRTGLPLRRYPRKYAPLNIVDDIQAVIAGKPLPPARANWLEEWRSAATEAERDTYRFEKGLNYFDQ